MVNHLRTLLANLPGANAPAVGHEYIPENFRPVRLPSTLERVRRALFGDAPDAGGINYRVRQFLPLLHRPDYMPWVLDFDSRVTYVGEDRRLFDLPSTPTYSILGGAIAPVPYGTPATNLRGQLEHSWLATATGTNTLTIDHETGIATGDFSVTWSNGLSAPILLPSGGGYGFRLIGTSVVAGARLRVQIYTPPALGLPDIDAALLNVITPEVAQRLFTEDHFRTLWESTRLDERLAGVLFGLVYATEHLRGGGT